MTAQRCGYCHKPGHRRTRCPELAGEREAEARADAAWRAYVAALDASSLTPAEAMDRRTALAERVGGLPWSEQIAPIEAATAAVPRGPAPVDVDALHRRIVESLRARGAAVHTPLVTADLSARAGRPWWSADGHVLLCAGGELEALRAFAAAVGLAPDGSDPTGPLVDAGDAPAGALLGGDDALMLVRRAHGHLRKPAGDGGTAWVCEVCGWARRHDPAKYCGRIEAALKRSAMFGDPAAVLRGVR